MSIQEKIEEFSNKPVLATATLAGSIMIIVAAAIVADQLEKKDMGKRLKSGGELYCNFDTNNKVITSEDGWEMIGDYVVNKKEKTFIKYSRCH